MSVDSESERRQIHLQGNLLFKGKYLLPFSLETNLKGKNLLPKKVSNARKATSYLQKIAARLLSRKLFIQMQLIKGKHILL